LYKLLEVNKEELYLVAQYFSYLLFIIQL